MKRYLIKHSFNFQAGKGKLMLQGMMYATDNEAEQEELAKFAARGSCEELKSDPNAKKGAYPAPPAAGTPKIEAKEEKATEAATEDDLSTVKGVGAILMEKLAEKGITKKSQLQAALANPNRDEEMKELLGKQHGKIASQFVSA